MLYRLFTLLILLLAAPAWGAVEIERVVVGGFARAWKYYDSAGTLTQVDLFNDAAIADYGAAGTTGSIMWAINLLYAAGGGTITLSGGTYVVTSKITFPNDGGSPAPTQPPIRITGKSTTPANGATWNPAVNNTVIIDLKYATAPAKIVTLGAGKLELDHLCFYDSTDDANAFILTTNTTLMFHDNSVIGTASGLSAVNDGIILGGTGTSVGALETSPFQGYGTVIRDNWFAKTKRAVLLQSYANNNIISNNTISASCGSSDNAPFSINGAAADKTNGNLFIGNLIELTYYAYGFKVVNGVSNAFIGNGLWDVSGNTLAVYSLDISSVNNLIMDSEWGGTERDITDAADNGSGLIRITTSADHPFKTGSVVNVRGVVGTVEANGQWTITKIDGTTFDLQSSTFTNTYTSGGKTHITKTTGDGQSYTTVIDSKGVTRFTDSIDISGNPIVGTESKLSINNFRTTPADTYFEVNGILRTSSFTEKLFPTYGAAIVRGYDATISESVKGILDIEAPIQYDPKTDKGSTLTFSVNHNKFTPGYDTVRGGIKVGNANDTNNEKYSYMDLYTHDGTSLAARVRIPPAGGAQIFTGTRPTCDSTTRFTIFSVAGGAGVADTFEVCRKDASNNYAWVSLF